MSKASARGARFNASNIAKVVNHASMSTLLREDEKIDAVIISNIIKTKSNKTDEAIVKAVTKAGYETSLGGCGCGFAYRGSCDDCTRIMAKVNEKLLVFWDDGRLEGVEMCDEDVRVLETITRVLSNYPKSSESKDGHTLAWKLDRLKEAGVDAALNDDEKEERDYFVFVVTLPVSKGLLPFAENGYYMQTRIR